MCVDDPALKTLDDITRIFDSIERMYVMLKLIEEDSDYQITSNSYKRVIKNYHVITIQKSSAIGDFGLFFIKIGMTESFDNYSLGLKKDQNDRPLSGNVTLRIQGNTNKVDEFIQYLKSKNCLFLFADYSSPEINIKFENYYQLEDIIEGIVKYLV